MELGPHADAVMEIVELVETGVIFRTPRPPLGPELKIIRNMNECISYIHVIADHPEDEGWDWRDLLEYAGEPGSDLIVDRLERVNSVPGLLENFGQLMDGLILQSLRSQLGAKYTDSEILFIWSTIDFIILPIYFWSDITVHRAAGGNLPPRWASLRLDRILPRGPTGGLLSPGRRESGGEPGRRRTGAPRHGQRKLAC